MEEFQDDKATSLHHTRFDTHVGASGTPYVDMRLWVKASAPAEPKPLPCIRLTLEEAAELVNQIALTTAAAQGVIEPPSEPMQ